MQARDLNKLYLSVVREGDAFRIVDQDGRQVAGVKSLTTYVELGEPVEFSATILDMPRESQDRVHLGNGGQS